MTTDTQLVCKKEPHCECSGAEFDCQCMPDEMEVACQDCGEELVEIECDSGNEVIK